MRPLFAPPPVVKEKKVSSAGTRKMSFNLEILLPDWAADFQAESPDFIDSKVEKQYNEYQKRNQPIKSRRIVYN